MMGTFSLLQLHGQCIGKITIMVRFLNKSVMSIWFLSTCGIVKKTYIFELRFAWMINYQEPSLNICGQSNIVKRLKCLSKYWQSVSTPISVSQAVLWLRWGIMVIWTRIMVKASCVIWNYVIQNCPLGKRRNAKSCDKNMPFWLNIICV